MRADYAELLNLTIIFLGGTPKNGVKFRVPGAFHHARWMSKAIYALKIYLFRNEFSLSQRELDGLRDICIFIVRLYVKNWFSSTVPTNAPNQDLNLLKDLYYYKDIDKDISNATMKKICGHLWYLTEEAVALSFFDKNIPINDKKLMVECLEKESIGVNNHNRIVVSPKDIDTFLNKNLADFVSKTTKTFFRRFNLSTDFLQHDPSLWEFCDDYIQNMDFVKQLTVVNDISERTVKLMEEFNKSLTNDEHQKQYLMLAVNNYRKQNPTCTKTSLIRKS